MKINLLFILTILGNLAQAQVINEIEQKEIFQIIIEVNDMDKMVRF